MEPLATSNEVALGLTLIYTVAALKAGDVDTRPTMVAFPAAFHKRVGRLPCRLETQWGRNIISFRLCQICADLDW